MTTPNSSEEEGRSPSEEGEHPTTSLTAAEIALSDPLKEETRKARVYLLVVSAVGIIMVRTGLVPQEISALGISVADVKPQKLLDILAFVVAYFGLAFAIYGISDAIAWWHAYSGVTWPELQAEAQRAQKLLRQKADAVREAELKRYDEIDRELLEESKEEETAAPDSTSGQEALSEEALRFQRRMRGWMDRVEEQRIRENPAFSDYREAERGVQRAGQKVERANLALSTRTVLAKVVALMRFGFEFVLPVGVGLYAFIVLF